MTTDEELRLKAEKRAEEKVDFLVHFTIYACVNTLLFVFWFFSGGREWIAGGADGTFPWFIVPLLGWGIGITAHFFGAFASPSLKDRYTEKEFQRLKRK
ncbi:MAG: 2TM domain-containing protein [Candidatus Thermoplasmatota archaeon]|nr:2TM domain-containing protein [Candidatus Thermoplasmatota archaeon]